MPEITLIVDGEPVRFLVDRQNGRWVVRWTARGARREHRIGLVGLEPGVFLLETQGRSRLMHRAAAGTRRALHVDGHTLEYEVTRRAGSPPGSPPRGDRSPAASPPAEPRAAERELRAPMPGVVTQVPVREGEAVRAGQPLVIIEAMKMEHVVRAKRAGTVRALRVRPGEQVEGGVVVAEITPS